jgi:hypothetical protein
LARMPTAMSTISSQMLSMWISLEPRAGEARGAAGGGTRSLYDVGASPCPIRRTFRHRVTVGPTPGRDLAHPVVARHPPHLGRRHAVEQYRRPPHAAHDPVGLEDPDVEVLGREAERDRDVHRAAPLQRGRKRGVEAARRAHREVRLPAAPEQRDDEQEADGAVAERPHQVTGPPGLTTRPAPSARWCGAPAAGG